MTNWRDWNAQNAVDRYPNYEAQKLDEISKALADAREDTKWQRSQERKDEYARQQLEEAIERSWETSSDTETHPPVSWEEVTKSEEMKWFHWIPAIIFLAAFNGGIYLFLKWIFS